MTTPPMPPARPRRLAARCIRRIHRGLTLGETLLIVFVLGMVFLAFVPRLPYFGRGCDPSYTVCARVSELILATSTARTALSEGMQEHHSWSPAWVSAITISSIGMVSSASINGTTGQIIVHGTAQTSGTVVTMTPSITTDYKLVWSCTGSPAKYLPASCR